MWGNVPCLSHPKLISESQNYCDAFDISEKVCEEAGNKFIDSYICTLRDPNLECCVPHSFDNPCKLVPGDAKRRKFR